MKTAAFQWDDWKSHHTIRVITARDLTLTLLHFSSSPTVLGVGGIASALTANAVGLLPRFWGFCAIL